MHISERGIRLIENFEGFSSTQYDDGTGVMTIGYGTTASDVSPLPTFLSQAEAEALLRRKLQERYEPAIDSLGSLNQNQYDALVSLAYNCGPGIVGWQIGADVRAHRWGAAADDFLRYVFAGGQVLQGLVNRREAERALFLAPVPNRDPHGYLRFPNGAVEYRSKHGIVQIHERDTVEEYDRRRAHPLLNRSRLKVLHDRLNAFAQDIQVRARSEQGGWAKYDRDWRFKQLRLRVLGRRVV